MLKKILISFSIIASFIIFTGCFLGRWKEEDATQYIQGMLESTYLNEHKNYVKKIEGATIEEAKKGYKETLDNEADLLGGYLAIDYITPEINERLIELLHRIYSYSNFTVSEAVKISKDNFLVKVQVQPIDILDISMEDILEAKEIMDESYNIKEFGTMSNEEFEQWYKTYAQVWAHRVLDIVEENIDKMGYLEEVSIEVEVFLNEEGLFDVSEDYYSIDQYIINY